MKPLCLILSFCVCVDMLATVRTVSNNPGTVAQYTTIQAAVNASVRLRKKLYPSDKGVEGETIVEVLQKIR